MGTARLLSFEIKVPTRPPPARSLCVDSNSKHTHAANKSKRKKKKLIRATPPDGVNFIPYMKLLWVE
jgi:hypothetical protein